MFKEERFELAFRSISEKGLKYFTDNLLKNEKVTSIAFSNITIVKINLVNNNLEFGCKEAGLLAGVLQYNTTVKELDLSCNDIGDQGMKSLANALNYNKTLTDLELSGNKISYIGIEFLAEVLKTNNTLKVLNLSGNDIDNQGMDSLANALSYNKTLTCLKVGGNNKISDKGIKFLAEVLKTNNTLREMDLSTNNFGIEGVKYLADMLEHNNTLRKVSLWATSIDSIQYLTYKLRNNKGLECLELLGNEGTEYLAEMLKYNNTLTMLCFTGNFIDEERFLTAMEKNHSITFLTFSLIKSVSEETFCKIQECLYRNRIEAQDKTLEIKRSFLFFSNSDNLNEGIGKCYDTIIHCHGDDLPAIESPQLKVK